jgi:hypothetical protein
MDTTGTLVLVGFLLLVVVSLLLFGWMGNLVIQAGGREEKKQRQTAHSLGFSPVKASPKLTAEIVELYRRPGSSKYFLGNVSRRMIPDGEMYLFDLLDFSGEGIDCMEHQSVAIVSPYLKMPSFTLFPKADQKYYMLSKLSNKVQEWWMSFVGAPVEFPEYPEFDACYLLTSKESSDWVRGFFDQNLVNYFSHVQKFRLHAAGNIFTFSEKGINFYSNDQSVMSQRVNHALNIFRLMQKPSETQIVT